MPILSFLDKWTDFSEHKINFTPAKSWCHEIFVNTLVSWARTIFPQLSIVHYAVEYLISRFNSHNVEIYESCHRLDHSQCAPRVPGVGLHSGQERREASNSSFQRGESELREQMAIEGRSIHLLRQSLKFEQAMHDI